MPYRTVKRMYILKGAQKLGIVTDGPLGIEKTFTTNLSDVSFKLPRSTSKLNITFKIKQKYLHFLMDSKTGVFHEPIVFDYLIALRRFD